MIVVLCVAGWALAAVLAATAMGLRRRLELVALAGHELRGPATAMGLAATVLRREPGGPPRALMFEAQLARMRMALDDLDAARSGARTEARPALVSLERLLSGTAAAWRPVAHAGGRVLRMRSELGSTAVHADSGRLAQALGNLVANAVEHGSGTVELLGRRSGDRVVLEVRDGGGRRVGGPEKGRGRGLGIATAAIEEVGGTLSLQRADGETVAAVELPVAER